MSNRININLIEKPDLKEHQNGISTEGSSSEVEMIELRKYSKCMKANKLKTKLNA